MHEYDRFRAPNDRATVEFVAARPFAIAVTSQPGAPVATHLPIVFPPSVDPDRLATLVGAVLWGHMGRPNPHWQLIERRPEMLLVHSSSHGYVSGSLYQRAGSVPTVDYAAVHLTGIATLVSDEKALEIVKQTVSALEAPRARRWDMTGSLDVFESIIGGVRAFEFEVTDVHALFKLSQDQTADVRARVRAEFARDCVHSDIASLSEQCE